MGWGAYGDYGGWGAYVSVGEKLRRGKTQVAAIAKKEKRALAPVTIEGRGVAQAFWGKAWCTNLESYSDYSNRLPRGRTYVRNGSVLDLVVEPGRVRAHVAGSELYRVSVLVAPLAPKKWAGVRAACSGRIDSLVELLRGELSDAAMSVVCDPRDGLFPSPREIELDCSCPDVAGMCKHIAATLYGVGARLDRAPELLFHLRGVDPAELVDAKETVRRLVASPKKPARAAAHLSPGDLSDIFGIEVAEAEPVKAPALARARSRKRAPLRNAARAPKAKASRN